MTPDQQRKILEAVAKAQADGWEIEVVTVYNERLKWDGEFWLDRNSYRGRPKPVEKQKVKFLAWTDGICLVHRTDGNDPFGGWKRVPNLDLVEKRNVGGGAYVRTLGHEWRWVK